MVVKKHTEVDTPIMIERMQVDDVARVAELDALCFPTPWSVSAYITEVHNHSGYYIVARMNDTIVGYAGAWLIMDEAHITTIGVAPQYRGHKIGERLLVSIITEAMQRGVRRATLEVRKNNVVAQSLYRKYGFHMVAVRRGYYTDSNEDALVMWTDDMQESGYRRVFNEHKEQLGDMK